MSLFKRAFAVRRLFQFRLRGLMLCIVVAGVFFAWWRDRQRLERDVETRDDLISAFRMVRDGSGVDQEITALRRFVYRVPKSAYRFLNTEEFDSVESFLESLQSGEGWSDTASGDWLFLAFKKPEFPKQALSRVFEVLNDPDVGIRRRAAYAIGEIGPCEGDDVLRLAKSVRDPCTAVRREVARALRKWKLQASPAARLLAEGLNYDEPGEATVLIEAIQEIDPSFDLTPYLVTMLRHRWPQTRVAAAVLLCKAASRSASTASAVIELLSDDDASCRRAAASALSRVVSPETALPLLLAAFKKEADTHVRHSIAQVISDTDRKLAAARADQ